jgi:polysaccharide deacetylase family protein (PEP-CTERM system associated)
MTSTPAGVNARPNADANAIPNIFSVDVEEWFHILEIDDLPAVETWEGLETRVDRNFRVLLDECDAAAITMTCFFLGWVAERYPDLVREAVARGHEISSHGHMHQLIYTQTADEFGTDLRRSREILQDLSGQPVLGYRAPGFSIVEKTPWAFDEIAAAGFTYDSSIFPTSRGHGGLTDAIATPHVISTGNGPLLEFPIPVVNYLGRRVCFFGGGYLRLFPYSLIKRMAARVNAAGQPVVYYIHPREIDPGHPRLQMSRSRRFKTYVNLSTTHGKLQAIMAEGRVTNFGDWIAQRGDTLPVMPQAAS